jgi:acetyl esterase
MERTMNMRQTRPLSPLGVSGASMPAGAALSGNDWLGLLRPELAQLLRQGMLPPLPSLQGPRPDMREVRDLALPDADGGPMAARLYLPHDVSAPQPMVVYFHGGGWARGDLALYDQPCRAIAAASGSAVLSVDYRLAPAHRFPAAVLDCFAATVFAAEHAKDWGFDPARLVAAGDSAGGNLAAAVCMLARERGGPRIAHQVLLYPPLDAHMRAPSYQRFARGPLLDAMALRENLANYIGMGTNLDDPLLSPLSARDLRGLPPATVIVAEIDALRDDGVLYVQRLREAGVAADLVQVDGVPHMALHMGGVSLACADIVRHIALAVRST